MITFQEVPDEVSLSFLITGCPMRCKGCHSPTSWNINKWIELNLLEEIKPYKNLITCVLFLWGEWHRDELIKNLKICEDLWFKTCLYTWLEHIDDDEIIWLLDYIKYWSYKQELWWLDNPNTNQRFYNLNTWEDLTHIFYE